MIVKPGYKTTELLAAVVAAAASWLAAWDGTLPAKYAAIASAIVAGLYAISRGITKYGALSGPSGTVTVAVDKPPVVAPAPGPQAV